MSLDQTWSWSKFCGHGDELTPWHSKDFGHCFEQVGILTSAHIFLAVISIYHLGRRTSNLYGNILNIRWTWFLIVRFLVVFGLIISSILQIVFSVSIEGILPSISDGIVCGIALFTWLVHGLYVWNLRFILDCTLRGPLSLLVAFLIVTVSVAIHVHTVIVRHVSKSLHQSISEEYATYVNAFLCILYILSLIPTSPRIFYGIPDLHINVGRDETQHLSSEIRSYLTRHGASDEDLFAERNVNCLSWISFHWAQRLMSKGYQKKILYMNDIFHLPNRLNTQKIEQKVKETFRKLQENNKAKSQHYQEINNGYLPPVDGTTDTMSSHISQPDFIEADLPPTLLKALNSAFAVEYYTLGLLKFTADCLGFAGPILLNYLVTFVEENSDKSYRGYLYVIGLFLSTFLGTICSTQFDYNVQVVAYKIRCALVTTIYKKCLSVSSVEKAKFTSGEIVNFMSTDTDRILNFCPSFHAFWSLPFQIGVSLFLLYQQVGLAFLAGLGFALLLIPINRLIAVKIGKLSKEMMHFKDERVKLMNEILTGIRVIKFYSWESHFISQIHKYRIGELRCLKGRKYLDALCVFFWATTPVLISILTFTTYVLMGYQLTAAKAFTSLSLFLMLIGPLNAFPWVINGLVEAWVSLKRVQVFINLKDSSPMDYYTPVDVIDDNNVIAMVDASFSWRQAPNGHSSSRFNEDTGTSHAATLDGSISESGQAETQGLRDISLSIKKGQLIGIIGKVGAGKSSLLSAIIGEMNKLKGEVYVKDFESGFALASQEAWIQHATVKENILFGQPLDDYRYRQVLEVCALTEDLKMMAAGDDTEIGENGVNLSGGQKARVALARAVYQNKELYLLDDPLSAVDAQVAEHIFSHCIARFLHDKTRLLCTHHVKFLTRADWIIVMDKGHIVESGPPSEILDLIEFDHIAEPESLNLEQEPTMEEDQIADQLVEEETREEGVVKASVYKAYWIAVGTCLSSSILIALLLMQASRNTSDWWLSYWVSHSVEKDSPVRNFTSYILLWTTSTLPWTNLTSGSDNLEFYLGIYGGLAGANSIFTLLRAFLFAYGGIGAAKTVHEKLLSAILKAPMAFFDMTPIGRIVNRFSSDLYAVDDSLPFILNIFLAQAYGILGTLVITCYGLPWFAICLIPLGAIYYKIQNYYRYTSRELKRLSSVTLSPVYAHFSESITGLAIIKAMRHSKRFCQENMSRLDTNQRAQYTTQLAARWLDFHLRMLGVSMVTTLSLIAVLQHQYASVNAGLVGLAISYSLSVTSLLGGVVMAFTETEKEMVSVERCQDYISNTPSESWEGLLLTLPGWPKDGVIEFQSVFIQYRSSGSYALNDVSLKIRAGEKVGIVGRTGAGKSSLLLALFRLVEVSSGQITVDGVNLAHLDLCTVRSRFAVIPQDPFLFSGSIKINLDPTGCHSHSDLWTVLDRCHLYDYVEQLGGLETLLTQGGKEFSVGQKQLICLARAMLTRAKILCIDEATASVDMETDSVIQNTIRQEFSSSTVLTIAHRINTIMDSDRVLVMKDGSVAEFDSPNILLRDSNSLFSQFVHGRT